MTVRPSIENLTPNAFANTVRTDEVQKLPARRNPAWFLLCSALGHMKCCRDASEHSYGARDQDGPDVH